MEVAGNVGLTLIRAMEIAFVVKLQQFLEERGFQDLDKLKRLVPRLPWTPRA